MQELTYQDGMINCVECFEKSRYAANGALFCCLTMNKHNKEIQYLRLMYLNVAEAKQIYSILGEGLIWRTHQIFNDF